MGFADDIVLTSDSPLKLQLLINICSEWALQNKMEFNTTKCKVMILNRPSTNLRFTLNNDQLEIVKKYKYLGIIITTRRLTTLYTDYFAKIKQKANQRLHCIKHFGFHNDGLRPGTALKLYILLIRPILEYGAQVLIYDHYYLKSENVKTVSLDRQT